MYERGGRDRRPDDPASGAPGPGEPGRRTLVDGLYGNPTGGAHDPRIASAMTQPTSETGSQTGAARRTPGHLEQTELGDFWVVPDNAIRPVMGAIAEEITETEFTALVTAWDKVKAGSGSLKVRERDKTGQLHAGFRDKVIEKLKVLMSRPRGRELITGIVGGGRDVTIRPTSGKMYGGAHTIRDSAGSLENPDGSAGIGSSSTIELDPNVSDADVKVHDASGAEISDPVYIIIGHEMIHARHNQEGRNRRNLAPVGTGYTNREEEQTVATGSLNENHLRAEHGLDARAGSSGVDKRP